MVVGYKLVVSFNSSIESVWVLSKVTRFELVLVVESVWVVELVSMVETCSNRCGLCCFDGMGLFLWCLGFSFGG